MGTCRNRRTKSFSRARNQRQLPHRTQTPRRQNHICDSTMDRNNNRETTSMPVPEQIPRLGGAPLAICPPPSPPTSPPPSPPISMLSRHETHCLRASPLRCWAHISPTLRWGGGGGALALPLLSPAIPNINSMPITLQRDQRGVTDEKMATFMFPYRQHWRSINASRQRKLCARAHTHTHAAPTCNHSFWPIPFRGYSSANGQADVSESLRQQAFRGATDTLGSSLKRLQASGVRIAGMRVSATTGPKHLGTRSSL